MRGSSVEEITQLGILNTDLPDWFLTGSQNIQISHVHTQSEDGVYCPHQIAR